MALTQTHEAMDLLTFDKDDNGVPIARVGTKAVFYTPLDERGRIVLTIEDMRSLLKENYRLGWNGHAMNVQGLLQRAMAEIGA